MKYASKDPPYKNTHFNDEIDYNKIKALLTQNKPFETIKLTDTLTEGETEMLKFEAVVGNPPYQKSQKNNRPSAEKQ